MFFQIAYNGFSLILFPYLVYLVQQKKGKIYNGFEEADFEPTD